MGTLSGYSLEVVITWEIALQTNSLTSAEIESVQAELLKYTQLRGCQIIGSQLGSLISVAIRPRATLKKLGGLRVIVERDLHALVSACPQDPDAKDITYQILCGEGCTSDQPGLPFASAEPVPLIGTTLWRRYSNPNIECDICASGEGAIWAVESGQPLPPGCVLLHKPTSAEFRDLASSFAHTQPEPARSGLSATLNQVAFYNDWVAALRRLRAARVSADQDLLRGWEAVRTERVAKWLHEALLAAGFEAARAAETVAAARPYGRRGSKASATLGTDPTPPLGPQSQLADTEPASEASSTPTSRPLLTQASPIDAIQNIRAVIHQAVDLMSAAELREIRIPAGLLSDAFLLLHR